MDLWLPSLCIWRGFGGFFFFVSLLGLLLLKSGPSWVSPAPCPLVAAQGEAAGLPFLPRVFVPT